MDAAKTFKAIAAFEVAEDKVLDDADINDKYAGLGKACGRLEQYHEQGEALARWCETRPEPTHGQPMLSFRSDEPRNSNPR